MATLQKLVTIKPRKNAKLQITRNTWKDIPSKSDDPQAYTKAVEGGVPVRVLHSSGSYKVIKNVDNLPEGIDSRRVAHD